MSKKLKIYLDTSVINFLFADDAPEFKKLTIEFFDDYVKSAVYEVFISDVVIREIEKTPDPIKKKRLLQVISDYHLKIISINTEAVELAEEYIKKQIIPIKKVEDAQHIAISTVNQMDILLSWNFKHLANFNKQVLIRNANEVEGYFYPLTLTNPMEVLYEQ